MFGDFLVKALLLHWPQAKLALADDHVQDVFLHVFETVFLGESEQLLGLL